MEKQSSPQCLLNRKKVIKKKAAVLAIKLCEVNNHISTFCDHLRLYHHSNLCDFLPSKSTGIYRQEQNRLNLEKEINFYITWRIKAVFLQREIGFHRHSGLLALSIPDCQRTAACLLATGPLHQQPGPESKRHEWAEWLIHPQPQPISIQLSPLWPFLRIIPSQYQPHFTCTVDSNQVHAKKCGNTHKKWHSNAIFKTC